MDISVNTVKVGGQLSWCLNFSLTEEILLTFLLIRIHSGFKQALWVWILKSPWPFCKCFILREYYTLRIIYRHQ